MLKKSKPEGGLGKTLAAIVAYLLCVEVQWFRHLLYCTSHLTAVFGCRGSYARTTRSRSATSFAIVATHRKHLSPCYGLVRLNRALNDVAGRTDFPQPD